MRWERSLRLGIRRREGRDALEAGVEEARHRGARLLVSHVADESRDPSRDPLADLRGELDAAGVDYELRPDYAGLSPADHLVNLSVAEHAQLIVIGLRRRSAVGKLILGSSAQRVLLEAPCPVLAVKAA